MKTYLFILEIIFILCTGNFSTKAQGVFPSKDSTNTNKTDSSEASSAHQRAQSHKLDSLIWDDLPQKQNPGQKEQTSSPQSNTTKIYDIWDIKPSDKVNVTLFKTETVSFSKNMVTVRVEINISTPVSKEAAEKISKQIVFCPNRLKETFENLYSEDIFRWTVYQKKKKYDSYGNESSSKDVDVFSFSVDRKTVDKINWSYIDEEFFQTPWMESLEYTIMNTWRTPPPEKRDAFYNFVQKFMKK